MLERADSIGLDVGAKSESKAESKCGDGGVFQEKAASKSGIPPVCLPPFQWTELTLRLKIMAS